MYIIELNDITRKDADIVGTKAANLGELIKAGFEVPNGFCISTRAYLDFLKENDIQQKILTILKKNEYDDLKKSKIIHKLIINSKISDQLKCTIFEKVLKLWKNNRISIACRSSSVIEDGKRSSFAGQFSSFINIEKEEIMKAVKLCWSSQFSYRALTYIRKKEIKEDKFLMAVIIQEMINSITSGILFTKHPRRTDNVSIIESSWGLCESIVQGLVNPDEFIVKNDENKVIECNRNKKEICIISKNLYEQQKIPCKLISNKKGFIDNSLKTNSILCKIEKKYQTQLSLSRKQAIKIAEIGKILEEKFNMPQDIEWSLDTNGHIFILQSRPITTDFINDKENNNIKKLKLICKGDGVAQGISSGKVLFSPQKEIHNNYKNYIFIENEILPNMFPFILESNGLVTEHGNYLDHWSTVCRELSIPCITNIKNIRQKVKQNQIITIDGINGNVYDGSVEYKKSTNKIYIPLNRTYQIYVATYYPELIKKINTTLLNGLGPIYLDHIFLEFYFDDLNNYFKKVHITLRKLISTFKTKKILVGLSNLPILGINKDQHTMINKIEIEALSKICKDEDIKIGIIIRQHHIKDKKVMELIKNFEIFEEKSNIYSYIESKNLKNKIKVFHNNTNNQTIIQCKNEEVLKRIIRINKKTLSNFDIAVNTSLINDLSIVKVT